MAGLMPVDEAVERILRDFARLEGESVPLRDALGRVLAETITSPLDLPPFAASAMDGYAVRSADCVQPGTRVHVVAEARAGISLSQTLKFGEAARIMTGAPVPPGADSVIPVELTDADWAGTADGESPEWVILREAAHVGDNIRPIGENVRSGQLILNAGVILRPQDIGMVASLGMPTVQVVRRPLVTLVTSGDELRTPGEPLLPGQIYDSNTEMLAALVTSLGAQTITFPAAADTFQAVQAVFEQALAVQPDFVLSTAGVSVGAADYVRAVLDSLGQVDFWKINVRPGKPLAYGRLGNVPFFGLPGNPVSALVTAELVVRPALMALSGRQDDPTLIRARVAEDVRSDGRRSYLRVHLDRTPNGVVARLTGTQSSGALYSMVAADGLLIVPEGVTLLPSGSEADVRLLR